MCGHLSLSAEKVLQKESPSKGKLMAFISVSILLFPILRIGAGDALRLWLHQHPAVAHQVTEAKSHRAKPKEKMGTHQTGPTPQQELLLPRSGPPNFHQSKTPAKYRVALRGIRGDGTTAGVCTSSPIPCPFQGAHLSPDCASVTEPCPSSPCGTRLQELAQQPLKFDATPRLSSLKGPSTLRKIRAGVVLVP